MLLADFTGLPDLLLQNRCIRVRRQQPFLAVVEGGVLDAPQVDADIDPYHSTTYTAAHFPKGVPLFHASFIV